MFSLDRFIGIKSASLPYMVGFIIRFYDDKNHSLHMFIRSIKECICYWRLIS